ncbi:hypothetical protein Tco_0335956 [Tanacetum coccineum]
MGVAIATRCRGYYKPGTKVWVNQGSRKIRILVDMYPCRVEERLTIKVVEGEEVLKIKTTVTAKDDMESTTRSGHRNSEMEDMGSSGMRINA